MAQFKVYRNTRSPRNADIPYLLDVQSDRVGALHTRVVAPLMLASHFGPASRQLNPVFKIEDVEVVMSTSELGAVPARRLRDVVTDLTAQRFEISAAVDFLFTGV